MLDLDLGEDDDSSLDMEYDAVPPRENTNDDNNDRLVGIRLDATLLCFTKGFRQDAESVQLSFSELRLEVWKSYLGGSAVLFNSKSESQKHGVTLLHLFDHLQGFQKT